MLPRLLEPEPSPSTVGTDLMTDPLACPHDVEFPCPECGEDELLDRVADRLEATVSAHHDRYPPKDSHD